jgi:carbon starvation protein
VKALTNRYLAGALGIGAALLLALTQGGGKGGLILWPLFGTTNQLVAGVTLLVVSIWLQRLGRPIVYTLAPMLLVASVTLWSMVEQLIGYFGDGRWLLAVMGSLVMVLDIWVLLEGLRMLAKERRNPPIAQPIADG